VLENMINEVRFSACNTKYLRWMVFQRKRPCTLWSPNSIRYISFMPNKRAFIREVIKPFMLGEIEPHILKADEIQLE
jgi:hypothetical protein